MNNVRKSLFFAIILLLMAAPVVFGQDAAANSVAGTAESDSRFDTLAAAIEAAGLADDLSSGEWTLFAPTDLAFLALGLSPDNIATEFSAAELKDMLLYHALKGDKSAAVLKTMLGDVTMANGRLAGLKFYEDDLYVNDFSRLIEEDIIVDNGRVHVVDTVIQPPWPRVEESQTVQEAFEEIAGKVAAAIPHETGMAVVESAATAVEVEPLAGDTAAPPAAPAIAQDSLVGIAVADGRFNTLIAAAIASGQVEKLAAGEWTAFVPTDQAFAKIGLSADNIAAELSQAELADMLLYHMLPGNNSTAQLKTMLGNITMANGSLAGLKFYKDHIYVNDDSKVIEENIVTENGTIHVVDTVIQAPWPRE